MSNSIAVFTRSDLFEDGLTEDGEPQVSYVWTTHGSVRGGCGHDHKSQRTAEKCLRRDQRGCASQGGYSDRRVIEKEAPR